MRVAREEVVGRLHHLLCRVVPVFAYVNYVTSDAGNGYDRAVGDGADRCNEREEVRGGQDCIVVDATWHQRRDGRMLCNGGAYDGAGPSVVRRSAGTAAKWRGAQLR